MLEVKLMYLGSNLISSSYFEMDLIRLLPSNWACHWACLMTTCWIIRLSSFIQRQLQCVILQLYQIKSLQCKNTAFDPCVELVFLALLKSGCWLYFVWMVGWSHPMPGVIALNTANGYKNAGLAHSRLNCYRLWYVWSTTHSSLMKFSRDTLIHLRGPLTPETPLLEALKSNLFSIWYCRVVYWSRQLREFWSTVSGNALVPQPILTQCQLGLCNKLLRNFNQNMTIFIQQNVFEYVVCKMVAISVSMY